MKPETVSFLLSEVRSNQCGLCNKPIEEIIRTDSREVDIYNLALAFFAHTQENELGQNESPHFICSNCIVGKSYSSIHNVFKHCVHCGQEIHKSNGLFFLYDPVEQDLTSTEMFSLKS